MPKGSTEDVFSEKQKYQPSQNEMRVGKVGKIIKSIAMSWYHASVSGFSLCSDVCHLLDAHNRTLAKARAVRPKEKKEKEKRGIELQGPRLEINLSNKKDKGVHSVMWNTP
jgi:hypothetical protein